MSVEIPINDNSEGTKSTNGTSTDHVNGMQNGYSSSEKHKSGHKSSSKDKYRDKDRHRDAERNRNGSSKHSSSSGRDKDKHSSSKDHHRSSHKSSSKDKDRSDKDKHRSEKEKVRSDRGEGDRNKEIDRNKETYKNKESDRKDKDRHSQTHDKYRSSDKDKDGKSSSRSEHRSSSSKDHKSSKSSHDKHRSDKDKHRHSSSSSKDKQHSSSRDKTDSKEKSSHNNEKDKQLSQPQARSSAKEEITELTRTKEEIHSVTEDSVVKKEKNTWETNPPNGDFLSSTVSSCDYSLSQFKDEPLDDVKMEVESEEDVPLAARADKKRKAAPSDSDEEEKPLSIRKINKAKKPKVKKKESDYDEDSEEEPKSKKKSVPLKTKDVKEVSPVKRKKKQEEAPEVWKWWEEEKKQDGTKWSYLEHKGPLFAPEYEKLPKDVVFRYDSKVIKLSEETEEVAGFYARMLDHDYTTKSVFNDNFFQDWRKVMTSDERSMIKDLKKCDFKSMHVFFKNQSEKNRNRTKEEKLALKTKNEEIQKEYGFCTIDGHNEKIGNFRIEPPGLFRGRGEHPKMGMLKKRVIPEHVLINCSKDSKIPKAPDGHRWKEVRHDNTVTWLASWTENVQGQVKYVMLNPSSKLKGEKDWQKYEIARKLHKSINGIRDTYVHEWKAKEMRVRQRAVALYFIDKLALRAGNEKDEDQADTVGCCSLRVEHIELHKELNGKEYVVVFDFLGKDSIRYYNEVEVEKRVFKNLELFKENKKDGDDLFDRLNTQILNEHLRALMPGLTAKVFRTYNASITLQNQLDELTDPDYSPAEKILAYNRANRAVAILCNHQRAVPKGHQKSMESLKEKINQKHEQIDEAESELKDLQRMAKRGSVKEKFNADKKKKSLEKLREQLKKLEVQETDRDENKTIALGTSKLNYLDPRISVAWCKKYDVPLEKIYNKTQRDKFRWAIDMADADYIF